MRGEYYIRLEEVGGQTGQQSMMVVVFFSSILLRELFVIQKSQLFSLFRNAALQQTSSNLLLAKFHSITHF
jgi:hypothetical protein